ncbi:AAA family ATPase [Haematobacter genomosp. 1]|uniref:Chromosome segregation protein SMC n=1 Tax=Haematobacter genomosp. 1 TaxID=366618 RepID=A0A212A9F3_9RHOB|nr:AAA family ATPase [Haematobacter genomosp. 1]OWJ76652.1 chromosome segregation protein SMC [Haematobacter genomosp. 1]
MRILSISGQNIASLAEAFTVDFTAEPLEGAGLFAITGETGAGKSSILDAMCLALYGDAPRLAGGAATDEVPDPSGDTIKARDSRAILRRGAAQGWAEVRFTARNGQDYIARWQARRARDKADGRLQNVSRSLSSAADGKVLASQLSAVNEMIVTQTGFSYEEFRRTVLLAQGDFDAFLRADTNDRAGLLEKVTGTGLYRDVSIRIYDRHDTARRAHDALIQSRSGYRLLSDEERTAMEAESVELTEAHESGIAAARALQTQLDLHTRHTAALRHLTLAEAAEAETIADHTAAAPERAQLLRLDRAAPLRAPWLAVQTSATRLSVATVAVEASRTLASEAVARTAAAKQQSDLADATRAAREAEFKAFGPIWDQAAALDQQILSAATEAAQAEGQAAQAAQDTTGLHIALDALQAEEARHRTTLTETEAALARLSADAALADIWGQVRAQIEDHATAKAAQTAAAGEAARHTETLAGLAQDLATLAAQDQTDRTAEADLDRQSAELATAISAEDAAHPARRAGDLAALSSALADMIRAGADHAAASADLASAKASGEAATTLLATAQGEAARATDDLARAEAQVAALTAPVERADLAASDAAQALRLRLEPDTPCPVCGATDHPTHADAALAALAASLRTDLAAARVASNSARSQLAEALRQQDRATEQAKQAGTDGARAGEKTDAARKLWRDASLRARDLPDCPALPDDPTQAAPLPALAADAAHRQKTEADAQSELARMRQALSDLTAQREKLRNALNAHVTSRETLTAAQAAARNAETLATHDATTAGAQAARLEAALTPVLTALDETGALGDLALSDRLAARVAGVIRLRAARDQSSAALATLVPRIATAASQAEGAAKLAATAAAQAEARKATLLGLQAERAGLLDGEATAPHRTRHNEARKAALAAFDLASAALTTAQTEAAAATARVEGALAEQAQSEQARAGAMAKLDTALVTSDLTAADLDALFAVTPEAIEALRTKMRAFDDAVTSARATLTSRRQDHAAALAAGLPEDPAEAIAEKLAEIDALATARAHRMGAIAAEVQRDAQTRAGLAGLEAEIATARTELDVWAAVNLAAGSRNGDRFTRIAQSITLDVLVGHANHHLTDLNPRYRLRRAADLALQVEDRDMADEPRATRSLSGGERFLVSLALALALSRMGGKGGLAATLFIDEGFGSLDATSLDLAIDALETLQSQGRQVGVISHVEAMKDRIPVRISVRKQGGGKSVVEVGQRV